MTVHEISLEEALKATEFIPKIFGLCPHVYLQGEFKLRLSAWRIAYTAMITIVKVGFLLQCLYFLTNYQENNYTGYFLLVMALTSISTSIVILICSVVSLDAKNDVLEALKNSGITTITPMKNFRYLFWIFQLLITISDIIFYGLVPAFELFGGLYLSSLICTATIDLFVGVISVKENAFQQMHHWIKEKPCLKLEKAICSFERVTTAAEHCNEAFGIQLLTIVGSNFIILTTTVFMVLNEKWLLAQLKLTLWCCAIGINTFRIVYAIDRLLEERNEFNYALNTLLCSGYTFSSAAENEKVNLHILMKKDLVFSAKGFFNLDYDLITSIIGAVTTYLVILIQFTE